MRRGYNIVFEIGYGYEENAIICLLAKGDETRQHEGDAFVPCRTDGDIFQEAVRDHGVRLD